MSALLIPEPASGVGDAWLSPPPPAPREWMAYFAHHSRSFRFAARFMPAPQRDQLARVYAYCRYTDDLVDRAADPSRAAIEARLATWLRLSQRAYAGERTEVALLDRVMPEMAESRVPFAYARELVAGMDMDLHHRPYADLRALRVYTYRVAGVIGLWLTELYGVHDQRVLHHAAALGHALQLTNILRDVGEDWARGRVYLPMDLLQAHGFEPSDLGAMRAGLMPIDRRWASLMEELMAVAESDYRDAFAALPALPPFFARPVAVAAQVYRGIHDEIRRAGYDTLRRRAHTSIGRKLWLAARGLVVSADRRAAPSSFPIPDVRRYGSAASTRPGWMHR
ncbi:MAG: phytoene/squalene synthase family protein [Gemmatimonadota bacterium]|nr:phytoene/squalene synthase family protein [Gemmatimonadota bacterium]HEU4990110.1 phytoene/squalene synthase family protein [Gemmatimonadaceae bacterium]